MPRKPRSLLSGDEMEHPSFGRKSQTLGKARTGTLSPLQSRPAVGCAKPTCWTLFKTFLQPPLRSGELPPPKLHQRRSSARDRSLVPLQNCIVPRHAAGLFLSHFSSVHPPDTKPSHSSSITPSRTRPWHVTSPAPFQHQSLAEHPPS